MKYMNWQFDKYISAVEKPKPICLNDCYGDPKYQNNHAQCIEIVKYNYKDIPQLTIVKPLKCCGLLQHSFD